jgi:phytoene desaturase
VIGSGFGGLAAAIRLQSMGFETVCYEAHDQPGGRATVYEDRGYVFDAGPTVITAPHCLEELFELSGRRMADYVRLLPVTPLYRLQWSDGVAFDYVADEAGLVEQVRRVNPADVDGYRRFADYARQVFAKGYEELGAVPFLHFTDMIRAAPQLARLRADRSVYATVSRFVKDEHLRQAFSFHPLLVGGNPLETSAIYTLIHWIERKWGVFFPEGGTGALVRGLVRLFEDLGGTLRLDAPVERVTLEAAGAATRHVVHAAGGPPEAFDAVVSNADVHHTYATLYRGIAAAGRCSCFISAPIGGIRTWPTTPSCSGHDSRVCCGIFSTAIACRRISACISTPPRSPIRAWPRPEANRFTCSARCPTWATRRSTGRRWPPAMATPFSNRSSRICRGSAPRL